MYTVTEPEKNSELATDKKTVINKLPEIYRPKFVVGVGASAGGLEALENLFEAMPLKTGMAFVLVQHLSPDYRSMMDELLARKTNIPIKIAQNQMPVEANTIFLLPPNREMIISNGLLYLTEREQGESLNLPINTFLRSLAEDFQENSIGIILSGTGSDGTKGCKVIHDQGGYVIAQDPQSCKFDSMPRSVIESNCTDLVCTPDIMPAALINFSKITAKMPEQLYVGSFDNEVGEFSEILVLLHSRFGIDFSQYKPPTITRRIQKRLRHNKVVLLREYIDLLMTNEDELEDLYHDLLIGVTHFFRDRTAFDSLRASLLSSFKNLASATEVRIWISACATGQEAYTLSILLYELINEKFPLLSYKIFATDIHHRSIQTASVGIYTEEELSGLPDGYIDKYFKRTVSDQFQIIPVIRKPIVFAQHNILKDPPFTRIHLISCRNLLIYFNTVAQQKVLSLFTFSLVNKGLLFLGSSESLGSHSNDYKALDVTNRIFRKNSESNIRHDIPMQVSVPKTGAKLYEMPIVENKISNMKSNKALEALLQEYVPASILINDKGAILHVFGNANNFISFNIGKPTLVIQEMVEGEAKHVISHMIRYVNKHHKPMKSKDITGFSGYDNVDIFVRPLSKSNIDLSYLLISFTDKKQVAQLPEASLDDPLNSLLSDEQVTEIQNSFISEQIIELEEELQFAHETLQTTVEELEASNEELQSSNEELQSSNEELQSTNEELQSVNEELFTVNAEFIKKDKERSELKSDESSIIAECDLLLIFLDENLCVRKMTPKAARLFNLIETDYGRPLSAASGVVLNNIKEDIKKVSEQGTLIEREVSDDEGATYLVRINAQNKEKSAKKSLLFSKNENEGENYCVILSFVNVTNYRTLQKALEANEMRFENTLNAIADGYFEWTPVTNESFFSSLLMNKLGYGEQLVSLDVLFGQYSDVFKSKVAQCQMGDQAFQIPVEITTRSGTSVWMICKGNMTSNTPDKFSGILIDFSEQKLIENKLASKAKDLVRSNQLLEQFAGIVSHDMKAPLRHIQNYIMFLKEAIEQKDQSAIDNELAALEVNTQNLGTLIDDLIMYSRVNSEHKQISNVNLNSLLDEVFAVLSPLIKEKNVHISCEKLPTIAADFSLLTHLFQNLISNACKYNNKKQPEINISHKITIQEIQISVRDNGIGFDSDYVDRIFLPFKRLVTKDVYEGNGIGLSICKTAVEELGGKITVEAEPEKGCCFHVFLPLNIEQQSL